MKTSEAIFTDNASGTDTDYTSTYYYDDTGTV